MKKLIIAIAFLLKVTPGFCTDYCVSSVDGSNLDDGSTWALAKQTVAGCLAVATADGDRCLVDSSHNFTPVAAITWDVATTNTTVSIVSVTRNGTACTGNTYAAGAAENIGATGATFNIAVAARNQRMYIYGMTIQGASGSSNGPVVVSNITTGINHITFDNCTIKSVTTNANSQIFFGPSTTGANVGAMIYLKDTNITVQSNAAVTAISLRGARIFASGLTISYGGANKPAVLFTMPQYNVEIANSNLSGYEKSGGAYFNVASGGALARVVLRNTKTSSTPAVYSGTWLGNASEIFMVNTDGSDTHNIFYYANRLGTVTVDNNIYYNTGSKFDGSSLSWKIVTTAAASQGEPFVTPWISRWSDSTSAMTASLAVTNNGTTYTDQNLWAEFEYLSNASFPQGTLATTINATPFDNAGTNVPADTNTWTGAGGFTNQILSSTFTPAERSLLRARLSVGAASKTLYLNPMIGISTDINNVPTRWVDNGAVNTNTSLQTVIDGQSTVTGAATIN